MHFAFFGRTAGDVRLRILEGRRSRLEERLATLRAALWRTRERLDGYTLELQQHGLESVEREVRWLGDLIEHEHQLKSGSPDPAQDHPGATSSRPVHDTSGAGRQRPTARG